MDEYDYRLITLLRQNGRRSISDLAHEIGLSRATVRRGWKSWSNRATSSATP